jgi:hypothetical protein
LESGNLSFFGCGIFSVKVSPPFDPSADVEFVRSPIRARFRILQIKSADDFQSPQTPLCSRAPLHNQFQMQVNVNGRGLDYSLFVIPLYHGYRNHQLDYTTPDPQILYTKLSQHAKSL